MNMTWIRLLFKAIAIKMKNKEIISIYFHYISFPIYCQYIMKRVLKIVKKKEKLKVPTKFLDFIFYMW